jgi:DNA-binding CsgD family transcriptional regulator
MHHCAAMSSSAAGRLLERSTQVAALDDRFDTVVSTGRGRLVFIGGEAGAGKTALIRHFCDAHAQVANVLWGACDPLFTPRPLGPLLDIAEVIGGELAEVTERGGQPYEVGSALMRELRGRAPAIVVVEDVHWADEATFDVLRLLGRRIESTPALVLASYRDEGLDRDHPLRLLLGELPSGPAIGRLSVASLSAAAVAELARPHGVDSADLYRKTGGNAFFVTEALAAGDAEVPANVRDAVLAHAARLGPAARTLLEVVAVVPPQAEVSLLAEVASDVLDEMDACIRSGMLTEQQGAVAFRHELARLAIEESIAPVQRMSLHRRVLDTLAVPGTCLSDLARLAHHAEAAADADAVLHFAPAAGARAALVGAHRESAAQYARALRFAEAMAPAARAELLERQAAESFLTDQVDVTIGAGREAVDCFREAGNARRQANAMCHLSHYLRCIGRAAEADTVARAAVALLEDPALPRGRDLAMAYSYVASSCMNADDAAGTVEHGERALELAAALNDTDVLAHALNTLGTMELLSGEPRGREKVERSLEIARAEGFQEHIARAFVNMAWAATRTRCYDEVEELLQSAVEYCDAQGLLLWRHNLLSYGARAALDRGQWAQAADRARRVLADTPVSVPRVPALVALGLLRARRGDPAAWTPLEEARALATPTGELQLIGPVAAARAEVAWLEGRSDQVRSETDSALELAQRRQAAWVVGELLCWRWRAGVSPSAADIPEPYALELSGDWSRAAESWTERGCGYEAALALASADEDAAQRRALFALQRLGARAAAAIVARRLRELGARGVPRGPRAGTRSNAAGLTPRELEILELLAEGLRNGEIAERLFLSGKTVDHHVSAILGKLGVRSRTEATRQATRLGVLGD